MKKLLLAAACLVLSAPLLGQTAAPPAAKEAERPIPEPLVSVTRHDGVFGGQRLSYTATASETYLKAEDGTPKASIFSLDYVKEAPEPATPKHYRVSAPMGT